MFTRGEYQDTSGTYGVIVNREKTNIEVLLIESGSVISAFKHDDTGDYSFANVRAHDAERLISNGIRGCTSKNGNAIPFDLGTSIMHEFIRTKIEYIVELYNGELVGAEIKDEQKSKYLRLEYMKDQSFKIPAIPYVKLTAEKKKKKSADIDDMTVEDSVTVRSVSEIALEKEDVSWLKGKKYYIVNDDAQAEKLFKQLESYNGPIAYDTETTGLKINCFGKINSVYQRNLEKYNAEHPDDTIRADRMVGIIFCVEEDVSYYFPAFNRKFKNLYQDVDSPERIAAINNIKARYTVGDLAVQHDDDMYNYVTKTPAEEFRNDVVLMERVRNILEKGHIVGHNGTFDWKVGYQYGIDTNFKDDTMIMHQLMYKFRSTTSNRGESSALKYLEKREFGMDAWELEDFFPDFKEDNSGLTRGAKKKGSKIDFSYMDYDGTRVYAPTDGDATFKLFVKYKTDMMQNHKDMEYIYQVEMIVSSCIAYMEFYGHRLDERMINGARASTQAEVLCIESEIRDLVGYRSEKEKELYEKLSEQRAVYKDADASGDRDAINKAISEMEVTCKELRGVIDGDEEHPLNLAAPGQVATLFYDILKIPNPNTEGKKSVAKRELKALLKERNADGTPKYPVVHMYSEYKKQDTLVTKFFDNLQYFQYPGGYIFSSYGQIAAATGRMSCVDENTLVTTVGGYKKIKDIKAGDLVYCYDSNNNIDIKPVTKVIDQGYKDCIELTWKSSGKNMTGKLVCTPDHKILSKDYGWVRADELSNGDAVFHVHRSNEDRPRLFGTGGICKQEQLVIKERYFKNDSYDYVIHHRNEKSRDNSIENLQIMSRAEHSALHADELVKNNRIKYDHLDQYRGKFNRTGKDSANYIDLSEEELLQMLVEADGVLTNIPMDFNTYKNKCNEVGFDYQQAIEKIRTNIRSISKDEFIRSYTNNNGTVYAISKDLGIGRVRVQNLIKEYKLKSYNRYAFSDESYINAYYTLNGDASLLAEKFNITDKDVRELNDRLNLVIIGVSDADFEKAFFDNKGSIRALSRQLGITFYKAKKTVDRLGLVYNHRIVGVTDAGVHHVYDIEVEDNHNFIANEICVHNCSRPNAQQYPHSVTKMVKPRPGYLMADADYSQIEYRVLTALAGNEWLAELFSNPDSDYHTLMASLMYEVPYASVTGDMRKAAKSFNFGIPYGMGFASLAILLTGNSLPASVEEAKIKYEQYFKNQPKTRKFFDTVKEQAQVNKYTETFWHRRRYYSFEDKDGKTNNARKAAALRQAGNAVIQGTAADVFKISVARNFKFIRDNHLLGKILIINMIHDEQLFEIDTRYLNIKKVITCIGKNMQFKIDGFPPLYIGAGVGASWDDAKGKDAEIHPTLLENWTKEMDSYGIWVKDPLPLTDDNMHFSYDFSTGNNDPNYRKSPDEWLKMLNDSNMQFRINKVKDYLMNPENKGKVIEPVIGNLLNLKFKYGHSKKEGLTDDQLTKKCLEEFIKHNRLEGICDPADYLTQEEDNALKNVANSSTSLADTEDTDEDAGYDDSDDENGFTDIDEEGEFSNTDFIPVDESDVAYGCTVQDLIQTFGNFVSKSRRICGIDMRNVSAVKADAIVDYLYEHVCDDDAPGAMEIMFLQDCNILKRTGIFVNNIDGSEVEKRLRNASAKYDFDERVQ